MVKENIDLLQHEIAQHLDDMEIIEMSVDNITR
jgi:hypothetical protein